MNDLLKEYGLSSDFSSTEEGIKARILVMEIKGAVVALMHHGASRHRIRYFSQGKWDDVLKGIPPFEENYRETDDCYEKRMEYIREWLRTEGIKQQLIFWTEMEGRPLGIVKEELRKNMFSFMKYPRSDTGISGVCVSYDTDLWQSYHNVYVKTNGADAVVISLTDKGNRMVGQSRQLHLIATHDCFEDPGLGESMAEILQCQPPRDPSSFEWWKDIKNTYLKILRDKFCKGKLNAQEMNLYTSFIQEAEASARLRRWAIEHREIMAEEITKETPWDDPVKETWEEQNIKIAEILQIQWEKEDPRDYNDLFWNLMGRSELGMGNRGIIYAGDLNSAGLTEALRKEIICLEGITTNKLILNTQHLSVSDLHVNSDRREVAHVISNLPIYNMYYTHRPYGNKESSENTEGYMKAHPFEIQAGEGSERERTSPKFNEFTDHAILHFSTEIRLKCIHGNRGKGKDQYIGNPDSEGWQEEVEDLARNGATRQEVHEWFTKGYKIKWEDEEEWFTEDNLDRKLEGILNYL